MGDDRITAVHEVVEPTTTQKISTTIAPVVPTGAAAARLVVLEGAQPGRHWALGPTSLVGRGTGADVTLEDSLVSREHVTISRDEAGWMVRDLGSRNGTFVNGRRVDVERLRYGDRLAIGQTVLLLASSSARRSRRSAGSARASRTISTTTSVRSSARSSTSTASRAIARSATRR
jgi:pSer/pThr/pTyr-binding forkhead associated (FHA) protein